MRNNVEDRLSGSKEYQQKWLWRYFREQWRTVGGLLESCTVRVSEELKVEVRQHQGLNSECLLGRREDGSLPGLLCLQMTL